MIKALLPAFIWLVIITYLSTQGGIAVPSFNLFQMDKFAHAAAYALLCWLILWGLLRIQSQLTVAAGLYTLLFAAGYGAFMEWVQFRFFPDRYFEYDDMLANTIGAAAAWGLFVWFRKKSFFARFFPS